MVAKSDDRHWSLKLVTSPVCVVMNRVHYKKVVSTVVYSYLVRLLHHTDRK